MFTYLLTYLLTTYGHLLTSKGPADASVESTKIIE